MSEKYDDRYLPATTHQQEQTTHKKWKLTKSQYIIYYWLVAHSCWSKNEEHYYIYDNVWTQKQLAEECGISTKTVQRGLVTLEEHEILRRGDLTTKAYQIYWPYDATVALNKELMLFFLKLGQLIDLPLFIKLYTLLVYGYRYQVNNRRFTLVDLQRALNLDTGVPERVKLLQMIALWEHIGLLRLKQEVSCNNNRREFIIYTIENIQTNLDNISRYIEDGSCDIKRAWVDVVSGNITLPTMEGE